MNFGPATEAWFSSSFPGATEVQERGWPAIAAGGHALLLAPTGSGKTLAAFLSALDRLTRLPPDAEDGVRVVYVSPLKALVYDIERNLRAPLAGIRQAAHRLGVALRDVRVDVRTGDTPSKDRQRQKRRPADILVTTPESLFLLLTSTARDGLRSVETVIVDEIHVMAGSKRGVHLALSLERLSALADSDPQRIGLSATQRPLSAIAAFLGGDREVQIVDASRPPALDFRVEVPVEDMENPPPPPVPEPTGKPYVTSYPSGQTTMVHGIWPSIQDRLLELIRAHRSTLVFVNSRILCERLCNKLNELNGAPLVLAHHGSISHERRADIEDQLKRGTLRALVATSSLELGIDMGAIDLVVMVSSPGDSARGLQRVGRAGHQVGATSIGRLLPRYRGELLECAAVGRRMVAGEIDATSVPQNCLDVLAQQVVAMVAMEDWRVDALSKTIRRAGPYRELTESVLASVLDMLSGRYPSDAMVDLRPRLSWDRATDTLSARKGARMLAVLNAGTIPDRGLYRVHMVGDGARIGELDEEMVFETRTGDTLVLGASTWRVEEITRDEVRVSPAPGEPGRLPFWRGEQPGRPVGLGSAMGALVSELMAAPEAEWPAWIAEKTPLDARAARNLAAHLAEQRRVTGALPTDRAVTVERFRDELGDWRVCILTPLGSRVNAPWAMALEARLSSSAGFDVRALWTDDGIALRFADSEVLPPLSELLLDPDEVEELVMLQLARSAMFAARFRENAARSLLLPRQMAKGRTPLWLQRKRSSTLMATALRFPAFPVVLETYRECLQDHLDLVSLKGLLGDLRSRKVRIDEVESRSPSPFARSLMFRYVSAQIYDGDAPLAERRALALTVDRALLRELLGHDELAELLVPEAVEEVAFELQGLADGHRARDADELADLLRRLGDLTIGEALSRVDGDAASWLDALSQQRRGIEVRIANEVRWIAADDAGRYRDALGVAVPPGLPTAYLETVEEPLASLIRRFAAHHGPFSAAQLAARWGLSVEVVTAVLTAAAQRGELLFGRFRQGRPDEWCDAEVLKRLKRRSLAVLRKEVEPVDGVVLARFLPAWQGLGGRRGGLSRLQEVVAQLEGLPISFQALEDEILPARIDGFRSDLLDQLGALGGVAWIGRGASGPSDGRVALYRRERVPLLVDPPPDELGGALADRLLGVLRERGACFLTDLQRATAASTSEVTEALWDLVWAGLVTNDTFQPLRGLRGGRSGRLPIAGGRWYRVAELVSEAVTTTERALARATTLLERYGVVGREIAAADGVEGGFAALYPVLREMADAGHVRRGHFVEGLTGAQFALPGAVDRLRACRDEPATTHLLAATDPANPWGAVLPWPVEGRRRVAGARVVLVDGEPVLYLANKRLLTMPAASRDDSTLERAVAALRGGLGVSRLVVSEVDGGAPEDSALAARLLGAGFERDWKGIALSGASG